MPSFSGSIVTVHSGETGRFAGIGVGLDSGRGLAAYYAHLSQVDVTPGQSVVAGQLLGATGEANGVAHLHFALGRSYADGSPSNGLNPLPFLAAASPTVQAAELKLASAATLASGSGTPVVTVWGGNQPQTLGPGSAGGSTPGTDTPATISHFAFPIAQPAGGQVRYVAPACTVGASCQVEIATPAGADVVAATQGTLEAATSAERAAGHRLLDRHRGLRPHRLRAADLRTRPASVPVPAWPSASRSARPRARWRLPGRTAASRSTRGRS